MNSFRASTEHPNDTEYRPNVQIVKQQVQSTRSRLQSRARRPLAVNRALYTPTPNTPSHPLDTAQYPSAVDLLKELAQISRYRANLERQLAMDMQDEILLEENLRQEFEKKEKFKPVETKIRRKEEEDILDAAAIAHERELSETRVESREEREKPSNKFPPVEDGMKAAPLKYSISGTVVLKDNVIEEEETSFKEREVETNVESRAYTRSAQPSELSEAIKDQLKISSMLEQLSTSVKYRHEILENNEKVKLMESSFLDSSVEGGAHLESLWKAEAPEKNVFESRCETNVGTPDTLPGSCLKNTLPDKENDEFGTLGKEEPLPSGKTSFVWTTPARAQQCVPDSDISTISEGFLKFRQRIGASLVSGETLARPSTVEECERRPESPAKPSLDPPCATKFTKQSLLRSKKRLALKIQKLSIELFLLQNSSDVSNHYAKIVDKQHQVCTVRNELRSNELKLRGFENENH